MIENENSELIFKAEVQKKVIAGCISNLHKYFKSRNWEMLAHKFRSLGYVLPRDLISCKICDENIDGYYFYKQKKIILCANNILDNEFYSVVTQELVKSFDDARAEIEPNNPAHVACSTIRGINLSGVCASRGRFNIMHHQGDYMNCVRDKSIKQFMKNKAFKMNYETSEDAISGVWDACFYDYEPFSLEEHRKINPNKPS